MNSLYLKSGIYEKGGPSYWKEGFFGIIINNHQAGNKSKTKQLYWAHFQPVIFPSLSYLPYIYNFS